MSQTKVALSGHAPRLPHSAAPPSARDRCQPRCVPVRPRRGQLGIGRTRRRARRPEPCSTGRRVPATVRRCSRRRAVESGLLPVGVVPVHDVGGHTDQRTCRRVTGFDCPTPPRRCAPHRHRAGPDCPASSSSLCSASSSGWAFDCPTSSPSLCSASSSGWVRCPTNPRCAPARCCA